MVHNVTTPAACHVAGRVDHCVKPLAIVHLVALALRIAREHPLLRLLHIDLDLLERGMAEHRGDLPSGRAGAATLGDDAEAVMFDFENSRGAGGTFGRSGKARLIAPDLAVQLTQYGHGRLNKIAAAGVESMADDLVAPFSSISTQLK